MAAQPGSTVVLEYGPQGERQLGGAVVLEYFVAPTTRRVARSMHAPWAQSEPRRKAVEASYVPSEHLDGGTHGVWGEGEAAPSQHVAPWLLASAKDDASRAPWAARTVFVEPEYLSAWMTSKVVDDASRGPWGSYARTSKTHILSQWLRAAVSDHASDAPWGGPLVVVETSNIARFSPSARQDHAQRAPWTRYSRPLAPGWGVVIPVHDPSLPPEALFVVPIKRVYMQLNVTSLRRVADNLLLPAVRFGLKLDAGSWVWSFDASLPAEALPDVEPVDGVPVELEALVNGMAFRLLVERITRDRAFAKATIAISGRGKAALLDAPYCPQIAFGQEAPRTAQQLANEALGATEYGADWTINWQAVDWLVPGGVWSHYGTQISALNAIASAAGSYLQPHATDMSIAMLPLYPTAPWEWDEVEPDYELPVDVVTREGIEWLDKPRYNRVYVSGVQQGVLGQVTRAGTAGDILAQMVTDPLITTAAAARQRGIPVLADTGRIANVSLRMPVLNDAGIIVPGKFIRYVDGGVTRIGIARSTAVDIASNASVWQTIGVETHALS